MYPRDWGVWDQVQGQDQGPDPAWADLDLTLTWDRAVADLDLDR